MRNIYIKWLAILAIVLFMAPCMEVSAQTYQDRNLRVLFIDHEPSTPSSQIIAYIRKMRTQALENDNALIIYMPNDQNPFVSLVNIKDPKGERDTQEAFNHICEALNLPSHNKDPWHDRQALLNLVLEEFPIVNAQRELTFSSVRMEFYLTSEFWTLSYNESILAPVYFALNVPELLKKEFNFDVYYNPEDRPSFPEDMPFGKKNLGNINKNLPIFEYDL